MYYSHIQPREIHSAGSILALVLEGVCWAGIIIDVKFQLYIWPKYQWVFSISMECLLVMFQSIFLRLHRMWSSFFFLFIPPSLTSENMDTITFTQPHLPPHLGRGWAQDANQACGSAYIAGWLFGLGLQRQEIQAVLAPAAQWHSWSPANAASDKQELSLGSVGHHWDLHGSE